MESPALPVIDGMEWLNIAIPVNSAAPAPAEDVAPLLAEAYVRAVAALPQGSTDA